MQTPARAVADIEMQRKAGQNTARKVLVSRAEIENEDLLFLSGGYISTHLKNRTHKQ